MFEVNVIEIGTEEVIDSMIANHKTAIAIQNGYKNDNFYKVEIVSL